MSRRYLYFRILICILVGLVPLPGLERKFYDFLAINPPYQKGTQVPFSFVEFDRVAILDAHSRLLNQNLRLRDTVLRPSDYPAWDDLVFSQLVKRLLQASAKLIVVTYPFPSTIDESRTVLTADASRKAPIVWASRLLQEGDVEYPPSALIPYNNYGFSNFLNDSDGVVRRVHLFRAGHVHLSLRAIREMGGELHDVDLDQAQLVSFRSDVKRAPRLELSHVLFEPIETWEEKIQGRIVFLGVESNVQTPLLTPDGNYTRAELHAAVVSNLIDGKRFIYELPEWVQMFITFIVLALTFAAFFKTGVKWGVAAVGVIALLLGVLAYALFNFYFVWIHLASPLVTIFVAYTLLAHYRLVTEEELRRRAIHETHHLRRLDEMKNNFVSLFSHDLKTPIAKIDAICDRLLGGEKNAKLSEPLHTDVQSVSSFNQELKAYINRILQLTRVESQNIRLSRAVCDLNQIVTDMITRVAPVGAVRGVKIKGELEPIFTMELDESMVREILQNVIENAVTYSPDQAEVIVRTREDGQEVVVEVEDHGPGIPENELPHVTEKFYRGKQARQHSGSGLGLYLVKYFTELHGGKVHVNSQLGQGTRVEIRFPVEL